jgi:hypothetical protein
MARKINALLDLAWATKSEAAIVGQITSEIVRKGWTWDRWGGNMGDIRAKVKSTRPHRGIGVKRLKAVIAGIEPQRTIRDARRGNKPIDWSVYETPSIGARRNKVFAYLTGRTATCTQLARINGELIFASEGYSYRSVVVLRGAEMLVFKSRRGYASITGTILSWHPTCVRRALQSGGSVAIDFASHETIVKTVVKGERQERRIKWPAPQRWVKNDMGNWSIT